jgi:hypothetical protein
MSRAVQQKRLAARTSPETTKGPAVFGQAFEKLGGRTRTRTLDPLIKRYMLYIFLRITTLPDLT